MTTVADAMLALLIIGFFIGFLLAFSMGANDVANAFGTSYGSRVLTFVQVCILASIFETLGSVLLGGRVSDTIAKGIAELDLFKDNIQQLMYGYLSALVGASGWLMIATIFKLPVSGTHSIVGAVIGFTMVVHGPGGVKWMTLVKVVASWFSSPLLAGGMSSVLFVAVKFLVLNKPNPLEAGCKMLPVMYGVTFAVISFMIIDESSAFFPASVLPIWGTVLIAIGLGLLCWLLSFLIVMPLIKAKILKRMAERQGPAPSGSVLSLPTPRPSPPRTRRVLIWARKKSSIVGEHIYSLSRSSTKISSDNNNKAITVCEQPRRPTTTSSSSRSSMDEEGHHPHPVFLEGYVSGDVTSADSVLTLNDLPSSSGSAILSQKTNFSTTPSEKHSSTTSEVFATAASVGIVPTLVTVVEESAQTPDDIELDVIETPEIRHLFSFIQVITATFASFSHGANDVSNAVGPIIGMYQIYHTNEIESESRAEWWILLFGGLSMSVGLWCLGKKVMSTIGDDLSSISPATGFCMELGTALTVLIASHLGVPISTTHCLVGSVICVSLVRSRKGVDWRIARNIAFSWLITVPASALISAGCMAAVRAIFDATHTFDSVSPHH